MKLPKFLLGDNTAYPDTVFVIHTDYPRFILDVMTDEVELLEAVDTSDEDELRTELLATITKEIGPIAKPDKIQVVSGLPKTRSGKIMRRILRKIAEGDTSNLGDTSTLLDPSIVDEIKNGAIK